MIPINEFVSFGGMNALVAHADSVEVGRMTKDPRKIDNYYVDLRFRFCSKNPPSFFEQNGVVMIDSDTSVTLGARLPSKKIENVSSDDIAPTTKGADTISGPLSESCTDELEDRKCGRLTQNTPQEPAYMPDNMWIARTQPLSAILKQPGWGNIVAQESATINSVCAVAHMIGPRDVPDSKKEQNDDEDSEPCGTDANNVATQTGTNIGVKSYEEEVDEIQPSHPKKAKHDRPGTDSTDPVGSTFDTSRTTSPPSSFTKKLTKGLVTRTSNLARKIRRKFTSSEERAVWPWSTARREVAETNEAPRRLSRQSSSSAKQNSGEEQRTTDDESSIFVPSDYVPNRFKRRRLIFGRRYKN